MSDHSRHSLRTWILSLALAAAAVPASAPRAAAQDPDLEEIKYAEDYERLQGIAAVKNPVTRAERLVALYKDRPDMDVKLGVYADGLFTENLDALLKQQNSAAVRALSERALAVRPKFGEAWLYLGVALKNEGKIDEAMKAFAKAHVIANRFQKRAKSQLDIAYRARNKGSLIGEEKLIEAARRELE